MTALNATVEPPFFASCPVESLANECIARLITIGKTAIEQAGSFNELRLIRSKVEALRVYQRAQGAGLDAINVATQLRLRADRRMGEAVAAMNKALPPGSNQYEDRSHDVTDPPTYAELGIDKKQASRWQKLAAVPEDKFVAILDAHEAQRAPVTTVGVLRAAERAERTGQAAEDIRNAAVVAPEAQERLEERWWSAIDRATSRELLVEQYTGEVEWFTPTHIITAVRAVLGDIDLDPASCAAAQESVQAKRFYVKDDDGLARKWSGRVFLNPPYSAELVGRFVDKLVGHVRAGDVLAAILLVDSRSDTRWFHQAARSAQRVCFTFGRLKFVQPGGDAESPVSGSALFYFGPDTEVFEAKFGALGLVYREPAFGAGRNDA